MKSLMSLLLAIGLLLPLPAPGQDAPPLLYHIELILFRQLDAVADDAWPTTQRSRVPRSARALPARDAEEPPPANFHRAAASEHVLSHTWRRLGQLGDVAPTLHLAWRQSHGLLRSGRRVRLDDEIEGLAGFIALRLGNRLVTEVDLTLDAPEEFSEASSIFAFTDTPDDPRAQDATASLDTEAQPKGFRLHQRRTIRLGENHYFDHPAFGMILRVERVEPATSSP